MPKGGNLLDRAVVESNFCVLSILLTSFFSRIVCHLKEKILEPRRKFFSIVHPSTNSGEMLPPLLYCDSYYENEDVSYK